MLARVSANKRTTWLIVILSAVVTVSLIAIPVMAAANVQMLWSNEPALSGYRLGDFNGDFAINGTDAAALFMFSTATRAPSTHVSSIFILSIQLSNLL